MEVIGSMSTAPKELTQWIVLCLARIYDTTGIVKAQVVADRLKAGRENASPISTGETPVSTLDC